MNVRVRRFPVLAFATLLSISTVPVLAQTCGDAYTGCLEIAEQLYDNCAENIMLYQAKLGNAADNYTATVNNIAQDDPNRQTKIDMAKKKLDSFVDKYAKEILEAAATSYSDYDENIEECKSNLLSCKDS